MSTSRKLENVSVSAKANVYFEGKVVSHSIHFADGSRKTLGVIFPGSFHFGTEQAEDMEIVAGTCTVQLDGAPETKTYRAGESFQVGAKSGFQISVSEGICEYICSFLN